MKMKFILPVAALLALPPASAFAASAGNSAGHILKLGVGARYAALGDTGYSDAGDSYAIFWNPAALGLVDRCSVSTSYASLVESVGHAAAAAACPVKGFGAAALGGQSLNYGKLDSRDNAGTVDGSFTPSDRVLSAAWGLRFWEHASVGAAVKQVSVKIDNDDSAFTSDAGLLLRFSPVTLGAALKNSGGKVKLNEVNESLPRTVVIGAQTDLDQVTLMAAMNSSKDARWYSGGAEYYFSPKEEGAPVVLRAGYSTRQKTKGVNFTFGVGIMEGRWALDYALVPYGELGLTHHLSVSCFFSTRRPAKERLRDRIAPKDIPGPLPDRFILMPGQPASKGGKK